METKEKLIPGTIIDNDRLTRIFKCSPQGGMRRSHATNALVLISDHTKAIYDDRWIADTFHYTGMGLQGDQRLEFSQNKTLYESRANGVELFLFEVFTPREYVFIGPVSLAGEPYREQQPDSNNAIRNVWVFPLKLSQADATPQAIPADLLKSQEALKQKVARKLSNEELEERIKYQRAAPEVRETSARTTVRDANVAEYAKRRARGVCQLCSNPAPFCDKSGTPFLEVHHVKWLSKGGFDAPENAVALCPNCHRKMHVLDLGSDQEALAVKAKNSKLPS
jgi:5-methylcytosine-specific restriction protein A